MCEKKENKKILAALFAVIYLFVALFSQNFHDHSSGGSFEDFRLSKSEKTFVSASEVSHFTECLSCHILHEGKYIHSPEFDFTVISTEEFHLPTFTPEKSPLLANCVGILVRGPPVLFI